MKNMAVSELLALCADVWDVPAWELSLLHTPRSTQVVHTRETAVCLLVNLEHTYTTTTDPTRGIVAAALKKMRDEVPVREGALDDLRRRVKVQEERVRIAAETVNRLEAMAGAAT
jgi:hypothetical protein